MKDLLSEMPNYIFNQVFDFILLHVPSSKTSFIKSYHFCGAWLFRNLASQGTFPLNWMLPGWVAIVTQWHSTIFILLRTLFAICMANPKRKSEKLTESLKHSRGSRSEKLFCRNWAITQPEIKELGGKKESILSRPNALAVFMWYRLISLYKQIPLECRLPVESYLSIRVFCKKWRDSILFSFLSSNFNPDKFHKRTERLRSLIPLVSLHTTLAAHRLSTFKSPWQYGCELRWSEKEWISLRFWDCVWSL